ncbi:phage tail protein [Cohnella zeiphila]|uniref:Phage tail protein n=1 Tax=Cohnella zeiphila TaxID=2761120 RepID=A0A7X0SSE6_9BACL|nr:tail fiber protein [Cohnella zeiphila]MBB6735256.1 phage tail protein [Cohnella zeiphila]
MSTPYLGEIRMFAGTFAPQGWALCEGQLLSISTNYELYMLIGTLYGGDGVTTFALPDLRGRVPVHYDDSEDSLGLAVSGGTENVTLLADELPAHTHPPYASMYNGNAQSPSGAVWAVSPNYADGSAGAPVAMNGQLLANAGGGWPHNNVMPSLPISFIISLDGLFP